MTATALERNAQTSFAPVFESFLQPDKSQDRSEVKKQERIICDVMNAITNGFASLDLPLKLRALVAAIIAAVLHEDNVSTSASGQTVVRASYKTLVHLLFRDVDGRSFPNKKAEVRRLVDKLETWQRETHITLCTIKRGDRVQIDVDAQGRPRYEFLDTQFELVFLDAMAQAMLRCTNPRGMRNAVQTTLAEMMKLPPTCNFVDRRTPDLSDLQKRDIKSAITKALRAGEKEQELHGDPFALREKIKQQIDQAFDEHFSTESSALRRARPLTPGEENGKYTPAEAREIKAKMQAVKTARGCVEIVIPPTSQVFCNQQDSISTYDVKHDTQCENSIVEEQKTILKPDTPPEERNPRPHPTPTAPVASEANGGCVMSSASSLAEARQTIDCFESVGVQSFDVAFLLEFEDDSSKLVDKWKTLTADELRAELPELLKDNVTNQQSLDVRITDPCVLQIDDSTADEAARLAQYAVLTFQTSPGSYQCWLKFPTQSECDTAKYRLLPALQGNGGSGGKMRFPGSLNCKFKHKRDDGTFPLITLVSTHRASVTLDQLESAGLLAPDIEAPTVLVNPSHRKSQPMPSRGRYRKQKPNGDEDRSRNDYSWMLACLRRQFTVDEVLAVALQVSERCRKRGARLTRKEILKAMHECVATAN